MACYRPLHAWKGPPEIDPETGRERTVFFQRKKGWAEYEISHMMLACGRCTGCRLDRSREWAMRCLHEARLHADNAFVTLTYNDRHLPADGSLVKRHFQLFMKRLRKSVSPKKVRFFQCGEYGSINLRPHYHAILFGHDFSDKTVWKSNRFGDPVYKSAELQKLWCDQHGSPLGFVSTGAVSFRSAAYVARYIMKKRTGDGAEQHYQGRIPEYVTMSRRPGIGHDAVKRYGRHWYDHGYVVEQGAKMGLPRYYDQVMVANGHDIEDAILARRAHAVKSAEGVGDRKRHEMEIIKKAELTMVPRSL